MCFSVGVMVTHCPCQSTSLECDVGALGYQDVRCSFEAIREQCPALKGVLVPNKSWSDVRGAVMESDGHVMNTHVFFAAYRRGLLPRLTDPVHRYLLDGKVGWIRFNNNHLRDLRAVWSSHGRNVKPHHAVRTFWGRLTELQVAMWLEAMGWIVVNLEAWGGAIDIECMSSAREDCAIEVKSIVSEDKEYISDVSRFD